jgi:hypothetical protein
LQPPVEITGGKSLVVADTSVSSFSLTVIPLGAIPSSSMLYQNYPNPFNPTTTIRYELPVDSRVSLVVYDLLGQQVADLVEGDRQAGYYDVQFSSDGLATGIYFYRLTAGTYVNVQKMLVVK